MKAVNNAATPPPQLSANRKGCLWAIGIFMGVSLISTLVTPDPVKKSAAESTDAVSQPDQKAVKLLEDRRKGFHCLSEWDGSHKAIVAELKPTLRNPDSFVHVYTEISPVTAQGTHSLTMSYRAENGFGGMSIGTLKAVVMNADCSFVILSNTNK
jgi:hypothetical protein